MHMEESLAGKKMIHRKVMNTATFLVINKLIN